MSGIIAAAGSVIGGLLGFGGSLLGSKSSKKQQQAAHHFEAQRIRMMSNDAKLAGIHPLAALGVASAYQNPYQAIPSGGMSQGLGALGQGISQAAVDYGQGQQEAKKAANNDELFGLQKKLLQAQVLETTTQATVNEARRHQLQWETANAVKFGMSTSNDGSRTFLRPAVDVSNSANAPTTAGIPPSRVEDLPATVRYVDPDGATHGPNPESADIEQYVPWLIRKGYLKTVEGMNKVADFINEKGGSLPGWKKGKPIKTNEDARDFLKALRAKYRSK